MPMSAYGRISKQRLHCVQFVYRLFTLLLSEQIVLTVQPLNILASSVL